MADFRKWVLVLAVLAAFVIPANAQVTCTVAASNIPVRAEGLAELVSQINLNCLNPGATVTTASFTAFLSTNVTSRFSSTTGLSEAVLTGGAAAVQGIPVGTNALVFNNVTIPTGPSFSLAINNVRVNASAIGAGGSVSVNMSATSNPANSVLFTGVPIATPATVQTGLVFSAATSGSNAAPASFAQCNTATTKTVNVTFKEGFASSFKNVAQEGGVTGLGIVPSGTASQGTRLFVAFAGIPSNVTIAVQGSIALTPTGGATAILVGFDSTAGGTGATITAVPSSLTALGSSSPFTGQFAVPITAGSGTAVYEITGGTDADLTTTDSLVVPVSIAISSGVAVTSSTTPPTISGGFAPTSAVGTASSSAPTPRFVNVANQNITLFAVTPCVTNLLFPFLTNQAGFDTGVALINTSLDNSGAPAGTPFNTTTQSGTCTVFYFGSVAGGGAVPAPQTTPTIPAGQMFAFAMSTGGVAGSTSSTVGFQGYAIVRCNFQYAHGYAFVSDLGAQKLAHGYLALVIPNLSDNTRPASAFSANAVGTGEQLAR